MKQAQKIEVEKNINFTDFLKFYDNDPEHKRLLKDIDLTENTIKMLKSTLEETKKHNPEGTTADIEAEIKNYEIQLQFCKEALAVYYENEEKNRAYIEDNNAGIINTEEQGDKVFQEYASVYKPKVSETDKKILQIIHDIEETPYTKDEIETNEDKNFVRDNRHSVRRLQEFGLENTYQIRPPMHCNCFLVELPESYDTVPNEVIRFWYNPEGKCIGATIRESADKKQLEGIWSNAGKKTKDSIILYRLDKELNLVAKIIFKNIKLVSYQEREYNFSDSSVHEIYLNFKYKKAELTRPVNGPTDKKSSIEVSE